VRRRNASGNDEIHQAANEINALAVPAKKMALSASIVELC
jgi:hypothetical protein